MSEHFFIFGDSICFGQGVSISQGWVTKIAQKIDQFNEETGNDILVINTSRNGNTTRLALERIHYDVQSHGVRWLLVQFGLNDCNYWATDKGLPRVSPKSFEADLEEILMRGIRFGAEKIFLNTNHPTRKDKFSQADTPSYDENNQRYNEIIRVVADRYKEHVVFSDIEQTVNARSEQTGEAIDEFLLPDGLHLSLKGHKLYFDTIWPRVQSTILEPSYV